MQSRTAKAMAALLSAGWLAPLWLGIETYLAFVATEVLPRSGGRAAINSFPYHPDSSASTMSRSALRAPQQAFGPGFESVLAVGKRNFTRVRLLAK